MSSASSTWVTHPLPSGYFAMSWPSECTSEKNDGFDTCCNAPNMRRSSFRLKLRYLPYPGSCGRRTHRRCPGHRRRAAG
eukprot:6086599-Prymnesium_polylepis.2